MYSDGFYQYDSLEEYWAWWSRHISVNRYDIAPGKPYTDLLSIVAVSYLADVDEQAKEMFSRLIKDHA